MQSRVIGCSPICRKSLLPKVGLEPTPTCVDRILSPAPTRRNGKAGNDVADTTSEPLAHSLARDSQKDPELHRVAEAWPDLPKAIRRAIMALVDGAGE